MAIIFPRMGRRPLLTLTFPTTAAAIVVTVRSETTGKTLKLNIPAGASTTLILDFYRRTITDGAGVDRSAYLDALDNLLWTPAPMVAGSNDLQIEARLPTPTTIVSAGAFSKIYDLDIDATYVYWCDNNEVEGGRIGRAKLAGTEVLPNFNKVGGFPNGIVVDATSIYWCDFTAEKIRKCPLAGGAVTDVATGVVGLQSIAVDGTWIYFGCFEAGTGRIGRVKLNGTELNKNWVNLGGLYGAPDDLVATATHLYFCNSVSTGSPIGRCTIAGAELNKEWFKTVAGVGPLTLDVDANYVWLGDSEAGLCRIPLARPEYQQKIIYDLPNLWVGLGGGTAVSATHAYFGRTRGEKIGRAPIYSNFAVTAELRWEKAYF